MLDYLTETQRIAVISITVVGVSLLVVAFFGTMYYLRHQPRNLRNVVRFEFPSPQLPLFRNKNNGTRTSSRNRNNAELLFDSNPTATQDVEMVPTLPEAARTPDATVRGFGKVLREIGGNGDHNAERKLSNLNLATKPARKKKKRFGSIDAIVNSPEKYLGSNKSPPGLLGAVSPGRVYFRDRENISGVGIGAGEDLMMTGFSGEYERGERWRRMASP